MHTQLITFPPHGAAPFAARRARIAPGLRVTGTLLASAGVLLETLVMHPQMDAGVAYLVPLLAVVVAVVSCVHRQLAPVVHGLSLLTIALSLHAMDGLGSNLAVHGGFALAVLGGCVAAAASVAGCSKR